MLVLILFALFAVIVCITAFIRGASAVNGEGCPSVNDEPHVSRIRDRDAA